MFQIQSISDLKFETSAMIIGKKIIRLQWTQPPICENFQFTLQVFNNTYMSRNNISLSCCEREFNSTDIFYQEGGYSILRLIGTNEGEPCNRGTFFYYTFKGNMNGNWASEASPTLGCSIEISRDIYNMYVCRYVFDCLLENNTKKSYAKIRGRNYVVQTRAALKAVLRFLNEVRIRSSA